MFKKEVFVSPPFHAGLVAAVGGRLNTGEFSDAVLAAARFLTATLREKSGLQDDGVALARQALGGATPPIRLNNFQTTSEKDEQKGLAEITCGFYTGIRNPRSHETIADSEEHCIRLLTIVDTILSYLDRARDNFDAAAIVARVYDPYFVPDVEYSQRLIADIPSVHMEEVFDLAWARRKEADSGNLGFFFKTLLGAMSNEKKRNAMATVGDSLRTETNTTEFANTFRLIVPDAWPLLPDDVRPRLENAIIDECRKGKMARYGGIEAGHLGTWGNLFGRFFDRRKDLVSALAGRLGENWYTQNFVGDYFLSALPSIVIDEDEVEHICERIAYAMLSNNAHTVKSKFLEVAPRYPEEWKKQLRQQLQQRQFNDPVFAAKALAAVS